MIRRSVLLALVAALALPAPAQADEAIAETNADAPLAGHGGWAAWSRVASGRSQLVLRAPDGRIFDAPLPSSSRVWDVSLGPDARGDVVAIYRRCTSRGCDVERLYVATGRRQRIRSVSSPHYEEATPAIWRNTVAFTRRVRGCDVPYVKTLGSDAPSRRLLKSKCLQTGPGHVAVRGTRVAVSSVDLSGAGVHGAGRKVSEVRVYSARGGPSRVVLRAAYGEESHFFGQVALDEAFVSTVRYGVRPQHAFVRVRATGGTAFEARAHLSLTDSFAKSSAGTWLYVESQDAESDTCPGVPCRVVRAPRSPFGRAVRPLPATLTVSFDGQPQQSRPLRLRGSLTRRLVQDARVLRSEPVPGVPVELRRRTPSSTFETTPYRGVTGPDGSYEIVVPPPIPRQPWYTAVAATPIPTWAGRGTVGQTAP